MPAITEKNIMKISVCITKKALINVSQGFIVIYKIWFKVWNVTLVIFLQVIIGLVEWISDGTGPVYANHACGSRGQTLYMCNHVVKSPDENNNIGGVYSRTFLYIKFLFVNRFSKILQYILGLKEC